MVKIFLASLLCVLFMRIAEAGIISEAAFSVSLRPNDQRAQLSPDIAFDSLSGCFLVVWQQGKDYFESDSADIYAVRITENGVVLDSTPIKVCEYPGNQERPKVAASGGKFLVVWSDSRNNRDWSIYAARITAAGALEDPNGFPIADRMGSDVFPVVAPDENGFLVCWQGTDTTAFYSVNGLFVSLAGICTPIQKLTNGSTELPGGSLSITYAEDNIWFLYYREQKTDPTIYGKFVRLSKDATNILVLEKADSPAARFSKYNTPNLTSDKKGKVFAAVMDGVGHAGVRIAHGALYETNSAVALPNPNSDNHTASGYNNEKIILLFKTDEFFMPIASAYGSDVFLNVGRSVNDNTKLYAQRLNTDGFRLDGDAAPWFVIHSGTVPVAGQCIAYGKEKFLMVWEQDGGDGAYTLEAKLISADNQTVVEMHRKSTDFLTLFPNPFNPTISILYNGINNDLKEYDGIGVSVFTVDGRLIRNLTKQVSRDRNTGYFKVNWDGSNSDGLQVVSGNYIVRVVVGGKNIERMITLIK